MDSFKEFLHLTERLTEPPRTVDQARRPDLIKGGEGGAENLPMGVRGFFEPTTSAFQTGKAKVFENPRLLKQRNLRKAT